MCGATFIRAAEQNTVVARKHIQQAVTATHAAVRDVVNTCIAWHKHQLSANRCEFIVAEQRLGTKARAVKDHRLGEREQFITADHFAAGDLPAGLADFLHQPRQEDRRLDQHGQEAQHVLGRKRMLVGRERGIAGKQGRPAVQV